MSLTELPLTRKSNAIAESPVCLKVARFVRYPKLSFEKIKVGKSKTLELPIHNASNHEELIIIDELSSESDFKIELNDFYNQESRSFIIQLDAHSTTSIHLTWLPKKPGSVREVLNVIWEGGSKLQAILLGHAEEAKKKEKIKKERTNLSQKAYSRGKTLSPSRQVLAPIQPATPIRRTTFSVKKSGSDEKENPSERPPSVSPISFEKQEKKSSSKKTNKLNLKDKREVYKDVQQAKRDLFTNEKGQAAEKDKLKSSKPATQKNASQQRRSMQKGLAMKKLSLQKTDRKPSLPRHPLPYAAKNMFYDERWVEKQERGFSNWLNFILTPQVHVDAEESNDTKDRRETYTVSMRNKQPIAPTKEDLSFKAYSLRRNLARLRRSACICYHAEDFTLIIHKIEREVECGMLAVRREKRIEADLGIKNHILKLLLSYNSLWLRIGLEVIFGEIILLHSSNTVNELSKFISTRLLSNADISKKYAHPSVPNLYKPGYEEALGKFTLKKFLLLVLFLDHIKSKRLIEHDPCLFDKTSNIKQSRDLLVIFSRDYLKGEGDVMKHLSYMGYTVSHVQTCLDEYDFGVSNLAVDLRDGVRLVRLVELLLRDWSLSKKIRLPAVSRLQKVHNVGTALTALRNNGLDIEPDAKSIVDGHREKTLLLLWQIIFHFQVGLLLDLDKLKEEISYLKKLSKLKKDMDFYASTPHRSNSSSNRDSFESEIYMKSDRLNLLLKWCRLICLHYGFKIENFTVSFSDGIAFCCLINFYHPDILPKSLINHETTTTCSIANQDVDDEEDFLFENWTKDFSPRTGVNRKLDTLLSNEKGNFRVLNEAVEELGGIPWLVKSKDMSNTIPDEKVVITFVSYLCSRLLNIKDETQAARKIQFAWRQYLWDKRKAQMQMREEAAIVIQRAVRSFLDYVRWVHHEAAAITIQRAWRVYASVLREERLMEEQYLEMCHEAALKIQCCFRNYMLRMNFFYYRGCVILCQAVAKGWVYRRRFKQQREAVILIQRAYRAALEGSRIRYCFLQQKSSAIVIQRAFRSYLSMKQVEEAGATLIQQTWRKYRKIQHDHVVKIQRCYKMYKVCKSFLEIKHAIILIQKWYRRIFVQKCLAACLVQKCWRSHKETTQARLHFLKMKQSAIVIQEYWRSHKETTQTRLQFLKMKQSAIAIQQCWRSHEETTQMRLNFLKMKQSAMVIQEYWRSHKETTQTRLHFLKMKQSAIVIQQYWRSHKETTQTRLHFLKMKQSAMVIQEYWRSHKETTQTRLNFLKMKQSAIVIQQYWKSHKETRQIRSEYLNMKSSVTRITSCYRMYSQRKIYKRIVTYITTIQIWYRYYSKLKAMKQQLNAQERAALIIQKHYRGYKTLKLFRKQKYSVNKIKVWYRSCLVMKNQRRWFLEMRQAVILCQTYIRGKTARVAYLLEKSAVVKMQSAFRMYMCWKKYFHIKQAIVCIQAIVRMYVARQLYNKLRKSTIVLQRYVRTKQTRKHFVHQRISTVKIQTFYRGYKRKEFEKKQNVAAFKIQSYYRNYRHYRRFRELQLKSAVVIQKHWRQYIAAKQYHMFRWCIAKLQSYYRMRKYRRIFLLNRSAAIKIQSFMKMTVARTNFLKLQHAAISIQSKWRAYHDRRSYKNKCKAVISIQSIVRAFIARSTYIRKRESIIKIQSFWRMQNSKRLYQRTRKSCILIQSVVRMYKQRQDYLRLKCLVLRLQALYRMRVSRCEYQNNRRKIIILQKRWRMNFQKRNYAASVIQQIWSQYQMRKQKKRENTAATKIQRYWLSYRVKKTNKLMKRQMHAATLIQSYWKMHVEINKYQHLRQCIIILQRRTRNFLTQRKILSIEYKSKMAVKIQAYYRMHRQQKLYLQQKNAARLIQSSYRAYCIGLKQYYEYNILRGAVITLQTLAKGYLQRTAFLEKKASTIRIQRWYKTILCRGNFLRKKHAVMKIQNVYRNYCTRKQYLNFKHAVIQIQHIYRKYRLSKELQRDREVSNKAASALQGFYKIILAKKERITLRKDREEKIQQKEAVRKIERFFFCVMTQKKLEHQIKVMNAIKIQNLYRMYVAKKHFQHQKLSVIALQSHIRSWLAQKRFQRFRHASILIQRRWRATVAMREIRQLHVLRQNCIIIQTYWRMFYHRKKFLNEKKAVLKIQLFYRETKKSTKIRFEYLKLLQAACIIQKHFRNYSYRKSKRKNEAAVVLTSFFKTRMIRNQFLRQRDAVVTIQSNWKCFHQRHKFLKMRNAVWVIERLYFKFAARQKRAKEYLSKKSCVRAIERAYKAYKYRSSIRESIRCLLEQKHAVAVIERCFKKYLLDKNKKQRQLAAFCIQKEFRRYRCKKLFDRKMKAILVIQRFYRRQVIRRNEKLLQAKRKLVIDNFIRACKQCLAVLQIQRWFRQLQRRKMIDLEKRQHDSATRIQALWKGYRLRRSIKDKRVKEARRKISVANGNVTEPMKLCNRTKSALDYLLRVKNLSTVHETLQNLDVATLLSFRCCEQLIADNALPVIFRIVNFGNRSLPWISIKQVAFSILLNIAKCPTTYQHVYTQVNSIAIILEQMANYRDKKTFVFPMACNLLTVLCHDGAIRADLRNTGKATEKLMVLYRFIIRKHKMDSQRNLSSKMKEQKYSTTSWHRRASTINTTRDPLMAITQLVKKLDLL